MKYTSYVNVRQGTCSVPQLSHGNTLPLVALPHGMNHFALDTRGGTHSLFYHPTDNFTTGIRLTHMPSPWINDYGYFTFIASSGDGIGARCGGECVSSFTQARTVMKPQELKVSLQLFHTTMHLIPTMRGAILVMDWADDATRRFCISHFTEQSATVVEQEGRISGYTSAHTWPTHENFKMYYAISFDAPIDREKTCIKEGARPSVNVAFDTKESRVTARIATSFVSQEQAWRNLEDELAERSAAELLADAEEQWEDCLSTIDVEADEATMRTFYSCYYRMMLFPRVFHEYDENGEAIHYSPDIGQVRPGVFYTDNGFWDTYKTVYPLYSILFPDLYQDMCRGFCNFFKEAGWLPRWMSPGSVNCMPGTAIDAVFGDAAVKGIVTDEELLNDMLESTMHHVKNVSPNPAVGRDGVESFNTLGYVTSDHHESVNKTQDYAYGNFCIAQIASALGKKELAEELLTSSLRYRNLFDKESGFLRARDAKGTMRDNWTPIQWGGDYTEGSAWQNSFAMFHDIGGMTKLLGGREAMEDKLDALFAAAPDYDIYGYGFEIHEMLEMAGVDFGQCALSNQPSFHIPYLYSYIGRPEKTAYWVRKMMAELFNDSPCGYPGDEDNGSMAGWYVFSALGFYPVCPGCDQYVIGSPAVRSAALRLANGSTLTVKAKGEGFYPTSVKVNGETIGTTYLTQDQITCGGEIVFELSHAPVKHEYADEVLPYSYTR